MFAETENPESLIAVPHWLRGVQLAAAPSQARPSLQIVSGTALADQKICVHATTIDGRFVAEGQYQLPSQTSGAMLELSYPTAFRSVWSEATTANSGIVLSEGRCGARMTTGKGSLIVPAVFNGLRNLTRDGEGRLSLVFSVHARNTQELKATLGTARGPLRARCDKIATTDAIQFNFLCSVALPADLSGAATLEVVRLNRGRKAPALEASIMLPGLK